MRKTINIFKNMFGAILLLSLSSIAVIIFICFTPFFGNNSYVDVSDSMSPKIWAGDVVVNKKISPMDAHIGDVVTFRSPEDGRLITHRVEKMSLNEETKQVDMVTRGDANTGSEKWSVPVNGSIGHISYVIPKAGFVIQYLQKTTTVIYILILALVLSGIVYLVGVWREPENESNDTSQAHEVVNNV